MTGAPGLPQGEAKHRAVRGLFDTISPSPLV